MGALEKLQQTLRFIDNNLHRFNYDKLCEMYSNCLPRLPFRVFEFDNKPFFFNQLSYSGLNVVYRAQVIHDIYNRPHDTVSRLSYMPDDKLDLLKDYGRVNKPGQAMFYAAFSPMIAAFEALHSDPKFIAGGSAFVTIGIWKFVKPMLLANIMISQEQHDRLHREMPESFKSKYGSDYFENQKKWLKKRNFTDLEEYAFEYFSSKFCASSADNLHYLASNYYADRIFDRIKGHAPSDGDSVDGILYSSVAGTYQEENIVLTPEAVNGKLEFLCAEQFVVFGGDKFQIGVVDRARADADGKLLWDKEEWRKKQAKEAE